MSLNNELREMQKTLTHLLQDITSDHKRIEKSVLAAFRLLGAMDELRDRIAETERSAKEGERFTL